MKLSKVLFGTLILIAFSANAQEISNHALGLRLGDSDGFGAEISYQKQIRRYNRLELDLGWRDSRYYNAFKLAGLYQWVLPIDGGFQWFYGFGGGLGNVDFEPRLRNNLPYSPDGGLFVFAAGDVGIEYNFDFPLLLSLDFRPEIGIIGYDEFSDNFDFDIALGVRYQF
ncbi:hypothetical protein [Pareuzebyella sediminis]|uniref:hypothetical protein n=1 Tax=Pareuzebyella sediminis TaxID=2607998 RepID=UPI0011F06EA5|nr:hypothetical protein [Pareuzebyella sediminis]